VLVETKDGTCRTCGGQLEILDADDATMTVECQQCRDSYLVEPDAFGDGCMTYYAGFLTQREDTGEEGGE
jgi:DNA-directed RNA polymerase subunit RPC12/RpoP